jgi:ankyrin repeat protein
LACAGGFIDVAKILLSNGADINLGQSTPLMEASQEGHIELVQYLIENGRIRIISNDSPLYHFRFALLKVLIFNKKLERKIQVNDERKTNVFNRD